jgi:hypothetical protein
MRCCSGPEARGERMSRTAPVCVLAGLMLVGPAFAAPTATPAPKHSGEIVAVAPDGLTITLDELGPWTGRNTRSVRRTVEITKSTKIRLDSRAALTAAAGGWPGGFQAWPLQATELHPGDFATVTGEPSNNKLIADSIAVVRTSAPAAPR